MPNYNRMMIYMNETDKQAAQELMDTLIKSGLKMSNPNRKFSISELFRFLVQEELKKVKNANNN